MLPAAKSGRMGFRFRIGWLCAGLLLVAAIGFLLSRRLPATTPFRVGAPRPPGSVAPQIAFGSDSGLLLAPDGSLWAWGGSEEHGSKLKNVFSTPESTLKPKRVGKDSDWARIAVCWHATVALKRDGTMWGWGSNNEKVLGPTGAVQVATPLRMHPDADWVDVQAGVSFFLALKSDGSVWAWGNNAHGQLGHVTNSSVPLNGPVNAARDWTAISAGSWNSFALKRDGTLWGWGFSPDAARGRDDLVPTQIEKGTNWTKIAAGYFHLLALRSDGTLWVRGQNAGDLTSFYASNSCTTLVQVGTETDWRDIYSGENFMLARKADGSWWVCGNNDAANNMEGPYPSLRGVSRPRRLPIAFEPWALACGSKTIGLLTRDGVLWTWGSRLGAPGQLGLKERIQRIFQQIRSRFGNQSLSPQILKRMPEDRSPYRVWELPAVPTSSSPASTNAGKLPDRSQSQSLVTSTATLD